MHPWRRLSQDKLDQAVKEVSRFVTNLRITPAKEQAAAEAAQAALEAGAEEEEVRPCAVMKMYVLTVWTILVQTDDDDTCIEIVQDIYVRTYMTRMHVLQV